MPIDPLLVVLLGPTASAKTSLSLMLAERFHAEIVNCDSVAMYREFEVGTAKPSLAERARIPHHLFDVVEPTAFVTAGTYAGAARKVLEEIKLRNALPVVVGGTGLYLRALLEGLFSGPQRSEPLREKLRERARTRRPEHLHKVLSRIDPAVATSIHPNDTPKLIRAIEVTLTARQTITELWQQGRDPLQGFRVLRLGLDPPRQELYDRINRRTVEMFKAGLVEEARGLLEKYGNSATPLIAPGYKQAVQLIREEIDDATAVETTQQAHRNYAKRQATWFRREPEVNWLKGFGDNFQIQKEAFEIIEHALRPA